jgi:hypothetical protein
MVPKLAKQNRGSAPKEKTMKFAANVSRNTETTSIVNEVFDREVKLATEAAEESKIPAGHIGLIGDFRGYTLANTQGRKSRLAGQTVVDLSAVSRIALSDVPNLVAKLQELAGEAPNAAETLASMADQAREASAE